ncbi:TPA: restriction endonuclease subunit S [Klebsiella pneumoniae]|uniref:restriction endonuclease subunit S n=1 Tax=Klebsiella pneumoniae TaxID=573 RepID=UPI000E2BE779|nr:restriction endonuclease subunit S [Klebsiella pneumoniae]SYN35692.1 restriction modification system DNA specificity domain-containing protein [Klebsiella pneumoniae]HDY6985033.1 restriction endonuclease subunit S [Klebsiella pneumoniae]HDZ2273747.1 restriction endonuclease subunit S [Klebsiella pneumoniae]
MKYNQWPRVKIAELCELIVDCVNKTAPSVDYETPYKMIRTPNIKGGRINLTGCRYVEKETFKKWTRRATVDKGDVLLTREAPMGEVGYVDFTDTVFLGQRIMQYRADPQKLDSAFLLYSFLSPDLQYQFRRHDSTGSIVSHIRVPDCSEFEISLPSLDEQRKIASTLRNIDEKIALNSHINTELEAMAKTLYDYWFVQFDFPDANGKPYKTSGGKMVYNAMLKREIPAGWAVNTLSQIANITMGQSPAGESYNEDGIGTLFFQGSTDFGWLFPTPRQYTTSPARMAKKGDILLSVRAPVGDMNIANADCCIGRGLAALNSKSRSDGFLFYVMKYFKQVFDRRNAEGTTFGSMTKDDLHSLQVVCPEPGLLKRYDDIVSEYNKMIFTRSLENQDLTKLRDWLLPLLMNGQITVK